MVGARCAELAAHQVIVGGRTGQASPRRFLPNTHHHSLAEQIFHTVRSDAWCPASVTSSNSSR